MVPAAHACGGRTDHTGEDDEKKHTVLRDDSEEGRRRWWRGGGGRAGRERGGGSAKAGGEHDGRSEGVVFCRTTAQCERLAERLGCLYHHSGQNMTDLQRKRAREQWASGRSTSRWIVATTGLGTGVDVKELVAVLHMGDPYGLVDFRQQTGRGGRERGEKVRACIFRDGQDTKLDKNSSDIMRMNHEAMQKTS